MFAKVAIPSPLTDFFTYEVPPKMEDQIFIGQRVFVPFGKFRKVTGFVVVLTYDKPEFKTKKIIDLLDDKPIFTTEMLKLAKWISNYYIAPLGEVMKTFLPKGIFVNSEKRFFRTEKKLPKDLTQEENLILDFLGEEGRVYKDLDKKFNSVNFVLNILISKGLVKLDYGLQKNVKPKMEKFVKLLPKAEQPLEEIQTELKRTPKQLQILEFLIENLGFSKLSALLKATKSYHAQIKLLQEKGFLEIYEQEVQREVYQGIEQKELSQLNLEQEVICDKIDFAVTNKKFKTFLLHGITGSGKTRVYINSLKKVIDSGKTGIVLVPEIALTPQTVTRFKEAFGEEVAVLHSRMSVGERFDSWRSVHEGKVKIVVGARSAIFAPLKNLGIIVVDEEHEFSYKQFDSSPRYQARDVAVVRGKLNNCVVILGSATPSVESFHNAKTGKYDLLLLRKRAIKEAKLPETKVVNLVSEKENLGQWAVPVFSGKLITAIDQTLKKGEQVILLQNKRGFSTYLQCVSKECEYVAKCENCEVSLVFHQSEKILKCHYCDYQMKIPESCPDCGEVTIKQSGIGTQKVENLLGSLFPNSGIVRMDIDTTRNKKDSHQRILEDFGEKKYQILLGTQMVAKGLDFPNVTLVGVVSADTGLLLPDFRAGEKSFQLLAQVSGRSGRGVTGGEVIIQTSFPHNPVIQFSKEHDYNGFFDSEIEIRKIALYPPFCRLVMILFRGENEQKVLEMAKEFRKNMPHKPFLIVLGPTQAPLSKIKNNYRYQILLKIDKKQDINNQETNTTLKIVREKLKAKFLKNKVTVSIDIDPFGML